MSKMKSKSEIESLYIEALGIKRDDLIARIKQTKLMAWEQLLLIAIYARKQYELDNNFHGRMGFVEALQSPEFHDVQSELFTLLDSGKSFLSIIDVLKKKAEKQEITDWNYNSLINNLERKQVAFSGMFTPLLYPHHTLYIALTRFISICQKLLSIPASDELCDRLVQKELTKHLDSELILSRLRRTLSEENQQNEKTPLASLIELQGETSLTSLLKLQKDSNRPMSDLHLLLDQYLAKEMQNIFGEFLRIQNSGNVNTISYDYFINDSKKMPEWVSESFDLQADKYSLNLNFTMMSRFIMMGQYDELSKLLISAMQNAVSKRYDLRESQIKKPKRSSLVQWQRDCNVLGLVKSEMIPSRIAAILFHDFKYAHLPFYSANKEINVRFLKALKPSQAQLLTTYVIKYSLHNGGAPYDFQNASQNLLKVESLSSIANKTTCLLPNPLMENWTNDKPASISMRFKRPIRDFNEYYAHIEELVRKQIGKAMSAVFPMHLGFPPPLWIPQGLSSLNAADDPIPEELNDA
ncbi:hypothetical protein [Pantoea ananatis]|uniref:hypothetical protein n=1 Tax=Pantoea ananas TaxID=553 RepID=UPI001B313772|nr:hypothetical protein [Pantoea ananatis]